MAESAPLSILDQFACSAPRPTARAMRFEVLEERSVMAGDVVINEIMSGNTHTLVDDDGEHSDWLELYNQAETPVNLAGWYLTDTAATPHMWQFPAVTIQPGQFMIVYASGKNRAVAGSPLHTNFKLGDNGEYLGLIEADGVTISSEYAPTYPQQYDDISFGTSPNVTTTQLVASGGTGRFIVPAGDLGANWNAEGYDDASWTSVTTGIGYDTAFPAGIVQAYTNAAGSVGTQSYAGSMGQDFTVNHPISITSLGVFDSAADGLKRTITSQLWARSGNTGTKLAELLFAPGDQGTLVNGNRFKPLATPVLLMPGTYSITAYGYGGSAGTPATYEPNGNEATGGPLAAAKSTNTGSGSISFGSTRFSATAGPFPTTTTAISNFYFSAATFEFAPSIFTPEVATNVQAAMSGVNPSVYYRVPFTMSPLIGEHELTLRVKYDDGFVAYLNGTEVARSTTVVGSPSWNSSTGGVEHANTSAVVFESFDISQHFNLLHAGTNILAVQGLNASAADADFLLNVELEDSQTLGTIQYYYPTPTPGAANSVGYTALSAPPAVINPGGLYNTTVNVSFTAIAGAQIRYTLDGTDPTAASPLYTTPLVITSATRLRARAFEPGKGPSEIVSNTYTILSAALAPFDSNLPLLVIDTFGLAPGPSTAINTNFTLIDTLTAGRAELLGTPDYNGAASIKVRGSSSSGDPKPPYAIETRDPYGLDKNVGLLDFPSESDWVLFAGYGDLTQMRDVLSYQWANDIDNYAVRTRYVEMYLNTDGGTVNTTDYRGIYTLMEKISRDPQRVDIEELQPTDNTEPNISGGYIFKNDRADPGDIGFTTARGQPLKFVDPSEQEITPTQKTWFINYLNQFETALYGANFANPLTGYAAYVDVDSFIDHHIMVEMTKNIDGYRLSTYFHKDRGGKIVAAPIWDYDRSLGNANYLGSQDAAGWYYTQIGGTDYPWWPRMFQDPNFQQRYIDRWQEIRTNEFATAKLLADVDARAAELAEAQVRNFNKWGGFSTTTPHLYNPKPHANYAAAVADLKNYITARMAWIDSQYTAPPVFNQNGGPITPGFDLTMSAVAGTIYYTLDGTDPRASGGGISPTALVYNGTPITLNQSTQVIARAKNPVAGVLGWSSALDKPFYTELPRLVVSEVNYNPYDPEVGSPYADGDFEFLEIQNVGTLPVDLEGFQFINGVDYTFGPGPNLAPGAYAIIVRNQAAFEERYPDVPVRGVFLGGLDNNGETIRLIDTIGAVIQEFVYDDIWYPTTDGPGASLVAVNPSGLGINWNLSTSWRPSVVLGGSPGLADGSVIAARRLFYNNSKFDGYSAAAGVADDMAIATNKVALLPGGTATAANYSNYSRGINGVMIDINRVPGAPALTVADFQFRVGNNSTPSGWAAGPVPTSISVRANGGGTGVDRVTLTWADGAIANNWLQVTMLATAATGLAASDVFYFGNAIGETGNSPSNAVVNSSDELAVRSNSKSFLDPATLVNQYDFNHDGFVNATDQLLTRTYATTLVTALQLISVPASLAEPHAPVALQGASLAPATAANVAAGLSVPVRGAPAWRPQPEVEYSFQHAASAPKPRPEVVCGLVMAEWAVEDRDPPQSDPPAEVVGLGDAGTVDDGLLELVVLGRAI